MIRETLTTIMVIAAVASYIGVIWVFKHTGEDVDERKFYIVSCITLI